jgi:hypothetical protein
VGRRSKVIDREIIQIMPAPGWWAIWLLPKDPWYQAVPVACFALYRYTDDDGTFSAVAPMVPDGEAINLDFANADAGDRWYAWVHDVELAARRPEFIEAGQHIASTPPESRRGKERQENE